VRGLKRESNRRAQQRAATEMGWQHHNNYANQLKAEGRLDAAERHYARAVELAPLAFEPHYNRGLAFMDAGRFREAEASLRRALALDSAHGLANLNVGNICNLEGRLAEAERCYVRAAAEIPDDLRLLNNLGQLLGMQRRYAAAERCYRRALEMDPRYAVACANLSELMATHGHMEAAETLLRRAMELEPRNALLYSNLLFTLCHKAGHTAEELFAEHREFSARFEVPLREGWTEHTNERDPERRLRLGFISADLHDHPLVRYLMPALRELAAHGGFELVAYNNSVRNDGYTAAYMKMFQQWRNVLHVSDEALATQVRSDRVDVLFDLSGHSGHNRLLVFARRAAPIQISWMGYPATTGLEAMDYFIADRHLVPETLRAQFTEKILELPVTTNFEPIAAAPEVGPLPALACRCFTFANLARANKLNRPLIVAWAEILRRTPRARLMLATLPDGEQPAIVRGWFGAEGIGEERIEFVHLRSVEEGLAVQQRIDLGLDSFPYNGSTGNAHALWMGVPTLALEGGAAPGRMGAALLRHTGLEEFVATDTEEYIRKAVEWTGRLQELAKIRAGARGRFAASALMQPATTVGVLAEKLRMAWRRWCSGKAAESF